MPIFEFKCMKCEEFFEVLVMGSDGEDEVKCPKCGAQSFERVMSSTSHVVKGGTGTRPPSGGSSTQTRTCSSGSCTTYTVGGPD